MFILDTDHISLLERADSAEGSRLRERLTHVASEDRAITIISFEEQTRGWMSYLARSRSLTEQIKAYRRLKRQLEIYCKIEVLDFDEASAAEYQRLCQSRVRIGTMDLKIAAIVLAHQATLLSRNLKDFEKVTGLKVEDWTT